MICPHCHQKTETNPCSNCGSISKDYFHPYNKGDYIEPLSDKKALEGWEKISKIIDKIDGGWGNDMDMKTKLRAKKEIQSLLTQTRNETLGEVEEKVGKMKVAGSKSGLSIGDGYNIAVKVVLSKLQEMKGEV